MKRSEATPFEILCSTVKEHRDRKDIRNDVEFAKITGATLDAVKRLDGQVVRSEISQDDVLKIFDVIEMTPGMERFIQQKVREAFPRIPQSPMKQSQLPRTRHLQA